MYKRTITLKRLSVIGEPGPAPQVRGPGALPYHAHLREAWLLPRPLLRAVGKDGQASDDPRTTVFAGAPTTEVDDRGASTKSARKS
jgi:hypothetical protein